jgi:hypothetical protein
MKIGSHGFNLDVRWVLVRPPAVKKRSVPLGKRGTNIETSKTCAERSFHPAWARGTRRPTAARLLS